MILQYWLELVDKKFMEIPCNAKGKAWSGKKRGHGGGVGGNKKTTNKTTQNEQ